MSGSDTTTETNDLSETDVGDTMATNENYNEGGNNKTNANNIDNTANNIDKTANDSGNTVNDSDTVTNTDNSDSDNIDNFSDSSSSDSDSDDDNNNLCDTKLKFALSAVVAEKEHLFVYRNIPSLNETPDHYVFEHEKGHMCVKQLLYIPHLDVMATIVESFIHTGTAMFKSKRTINTKLLFFRVGDFVSPLASYIISDNRMIVSLDRQMIAILGLNEYITMYVHSIRTIDDILNFRPVYSYCQKSFFTDTSIFGRNVQFAGNVGFVITHRHDNALVVTYIPLPGSAIPAPKKHIIRVHNLYNISCSVDKVYYIDSGNLMSLDFVSSQVDTILRNKHLTGVVCVSTFGQYVVVGSGLVNCDVHCVDVCSGTIMFMIPNAIRPSSGLTVWSFVLGDTLLIQQNKCCFTIGSLKGFSVLDGSCVLRERWDSISIIEPLYPTTLPLDSALPLPVPKSSLRSLCIARLHRTLPTVCKRKNDAPPLLACINSLPFHLAREIKACTLRSRQAVTKKASMKTKK